MANHQADPLFLHPILHAALPAMFNGNTYIAWRGIAGDHDIWTTFM
jgi:hypothetical protein